MSDSKICKLALAVSFFAYAAVPALASPSKNFSDVDYICPGDHIDDGFIIDSSIKDERLSSACPKGEVFQIRNYVTLNMLYMCPGSPVPPDWVISSVVPSVVVGASCPGGQSYLIRNSVGQSLMYMCPGSPLPGGWVISSVIPSTNVGDSCPGGNSYQIRNSAPPPPPPPPAIPSAVAMLPVVKSGSGHTVSWTPAGDYPEFRLRFIVEQSINGGGWRQVYKGWDRTSWATLNASPATYSYRVKRITPVADGQYSGVVSITEGGL